MDDPILTQFLVENGWMTEEQVAAFEGCDIQTIKSRRSRGGMPNHRKVGKTILYLRSEYAKLIETDRLRERNPPASAASQDILDGAA